MNQETVWSYDEHLTELEFYMEAHCSSKDRFLDLFSILKRGIDNFFFNYQDDKATRIINRWLGQ